MLYSKYAFVTKVIQFFKTGWQEDVMEIEIKNNDIILHGVKCLDLELTLDCGQAFR